MGCRVHTCCGCCSVRVGAVIVGVLYMIIACAGDIVLAVIDIVEVFTAATPSNDVTRNSTNGTDGNGTDGGTALEKIRIATWVELGVDVLFFIFCVLLIVGAVKNNRILCMIWLVVAGLWTALMAGEAVYLTVDQYLALGSLQALGEIFLDMLIIKWGALVVWLIMLIIGAIVVSSHVAEIRDKYSAQLMMTERSYPT